MEMPQLGKGISFPPGSPSWHGDLMVPLLGGQGTPGEQLRDVGWPSYRGSWWQGKDRAGVGATGVSASYSSALLLQPMGADNKHAHKLRAQALLLQQLAKELVPTPSSNLKTTVSPHSSCQNLQAPPQLP